MTARSNTDHESTAPDPVIDWLLDGDPAIRWQVLRDLLDAPEAAWQGERTRVETEGWGAQLLAAQDGDGQWAGGSFVPRNFDWSSMQTDGQPWTATTWVLTQLREFGFDPATERAQRTVRLLADSCRWEHDNQPFWEGEVEECINGRNVADGAYFGVDMTPVVQRLLSERQPDGGWNCERANGSTRSSFHSTINVLEGLLEYQDASGGADAVREARAAGEEFLLARHLFRRLSTGAAAEERFLHFAHPCRWHYDVLRALDYFRAANAHAPTPPDPRLSEAIDHLRARQQDDGRWLVDWTPHGATWLDVNDGAGQPSRWITLRALRVLRWWDAARSATTA